MVGEGLQNYVDLAAGVTRATAEKARAAAKGLLATAGLDDVATDAGDRVTKLAEEVLAASRANRELMAKLIAAEVDKAAARLGFVRADELDTLRREMTDLRQTLLHETTPAETARAAPRSQEPTSGPRPTDPLLGESPVGEALAEPVAMTATTPPSAAKTAAAKRAAGPAQTPAKKPTTRTATTRTATTRTATPRLAPTRTATPRTAPTANKAAAAKKVASQRSIAEAAGRTASESESHSESESESES